MRIMNPLRKVSKNLTHTHSHTQSHLQLQPETTLLYYFDLFCCARSFNTISYITSTSTGVSMLCGDCEA